MPPTGRKMALWPALVLLTIWYRLPADCQNAIALVGSGSNLPTPRYSHWTEEFNKLSPNVQVRYLSTGTMKGIDDLPWRRRFRCWGSAHERRTVERCEGPHFANPYSAGRHRPHLSPPRRTKRPSFFGVRPGRYLPWKHQDLGGPEDCGKHRSFALPHLNIAVIHCTEGKGSNYIFTDFLSKVSSKWRNEIGKTPSPSWLVGTAAHRGEDMMEKVKSTPGAIGYIELGFTENDKTVSVGLVQNSAGNFVSATEASIVAAYHSFEKSMPADVRASLTNASGKNAYPVTSFTWLKVPEKSTDPERSKALAHYLEWALTTGQQSAERHGYTPLPASLAPKVLAKARALH